MWVVTRVLYLVIGNDSLGLLEYFVKGLRSIGIESWMKRRRGKERVKRDIFTFTFAMKTSEVTSLHHD